MQEQHLETKACVLETPKRLTMMKAYTGLVDLGAKPLDDSSTMSIGVCAFD